MVGDAFIIILGFTDEDPDVEVLARSENTFFRFYVPKHARLVREFWRHIGVRNVLKLQPGAYHDTRGGTGPYTLSGMAIGEDLPEEAPSDEAELPPEEGQPILSVGTTVLVGVRVEHLDADA